MVIRSRITWIGCGVLAFVCVAVQLHFLTAIDYKTGKVVWRHRYWGGGGYGYPGYGNGGYGGYG
jgi:hypothetical protein